MLPTHHPGHYALSKKGERMPAYVVVEVTVMDAENYERYKQLAPPTIGLYGGRYLARG